MPTGYDKKEVEQIVKKKRNVDSNALSLTNIAVIYVTVPTYLFVKNTLDFCCF